MFVSNLSPRAIFILHTEFYRPRRFSTTFVLCATWASFTKPPKKLSPSHIITTRQTTLYKHFTQNVVLGWWRKIRQQFICYSTHGISFFAITFNKWSRQIFLSFAGFHPLKSWNRISTRLLPFLLLSFSHNSKVFHVYFNVYLALFKRSKRLACVVTLQSHSV